MLGVTGPMSRKATFKKSGVFMGNATFKSNTNLHFKVHCLNQRLYHSLYSYYQNYETLGEINGSSSPSPVSTQVDDCLSLFLFCLFQDLDTGSVRVNRSANLSIETGENGV